MPSRLFKFLTISPTALVIPAIVLSLLVATDIFFTVTGGSASRGRGERLIAQSELVIGQNNQTNSALQTIIQNQASVIRACGFPVNSHER